MTQQLMINKIVILSTLLSLLGCVFQPINSELIHYYRVETHKPYDEVLSELEIAIAEHNFRITGHSRVGKVIRERGDKDFPDYDTVQFCNLTHAKTLLSLSPHLVSYMPCNIVVYAFEDKIIVQTHLLPNDTNNPLINEFTEKMNKMLREIVDFAVEE